MSKNIVIVQTKKETLEIVAKGPQGPVGPQGPAGDGALPEQSATVLNNQDEPADLTGMLLSGFKAALMFYLIQRITTGAGATVLVESGIYLVSFDGTNWNLTPMGSDADAGIDLSLDGSQVQYMSSDITGTPNISKFNWRFIPLAG